MIHRVLCWLCILLTALPASAQELSLLPSILREEQDLEAALQPRAALFISAFGDESDVRLTQGGAEAAWFPTAFLPLALRALYGRIEQDEAAFRPRSSYDRLAVVLDAGEVFPVPAVGILGRISYEGFDGREDNLLGGRLEVRRHLEDGSRLGLRLARESFWTEQDNRNPRTFNRLSDLSRLDDPDFHLDRAALHANWRMRQDRSLYLEAGGDLYQDDNRRGWAYAHFQQEILDSGPGRWTVLRPNLYAEFVDRRDPAYFSPDRHLTLGVMAHTIRTYGPWTVEAEANPQVLLTDDLGAVGIHGAADLGYAVGAWNLGLGGFGYADSREYWLWRGLFKLTRAF